nr:MULTISPECIES: cytochrome c oxidase assembly protein [unclassified Leucobacter]
MILGPAALLVFSVAALAVGLQIGGAGAERQLLDPGAFVRFAGPLARTLVNLSGGILLGALIFQLWSYSTERREWQLGLDLAAGAAALLTVSAATTLIVTYVDVSGLAFSSSEAFGAGLAQFVTEIELGRLWLQVVLVAAATSVLCFAVRDRRLALLPLIAAGVAMFPLAAQGHAAGASGHSQAVNALLVHLVGAGAWIGGLVSLVLVSRFVDRPRLAVLASRYSSIALFAFIGVAASGVVSGWIRVGSLEALFGTGYGILLLIKTGTLIVLGVFGALQRQFLLRRIDRPGAAGARIFTWFVVLELAVMGIASGIAGALGRSETPVALEPARGSNGLVSPAEWLTGDPLPPELLPSSFLTVWKFDLAWTLVCVFAVGLYLAGVIRLHRRGDTWPIGRTILWVAGMVGLFYATNGALNAYEQVLFSMHMLMHMLLMMMIPLLLVLGAPITLLLRATKKRQDGSWGAREWVMWMVQTPYSKFITHPLVASVIFVGSLWVFYFSGLFRWSMEEHLGHQWMIVHFLISGYLFCLSMIGVDPVPYRFPYALRLVTLFASMGFHAFFGVMIMGSTGLLLADWYGAMGRTWGATPLEDQSAGGGIAWGIGELPTFALALIVAVQWARSDERETKRRDRAADRSGEAELEAYNARLGKIAARDERMGKREG